MALVGMHPKVFTKEIDINLKGGPLWKTCSLEDSYTSPNIFCGGHRYSYQMENAIKVGGIVFSKYHLG